MIERQVKLYIVVPCYNEEEVLPDSSEKLLGLMEFMRRKGIVSESSRIVFVDDGSKDKTWEIIERLQESNRDILGIKMAHMSGIRMLSTEVL